MSIRDQTRRTVRAISSDFKTRSDGGKLRIEGYFAVFNSNYDILDGYSESIAPGAFAESIGRDDIRALVNHDTTLVLGRTTAGTLELREDEHGLWGSILINPNDSDAMNAYARVNRGDVNQCSFGFVIEDEDVEHSVNGTTHWTIKKVRLLEVSCCTFPAYTKTSIEARRKDADALKARAEQWKEAMKTRIRR